MFDDKTNSSKKEDFVLYRRQRDPFRNHDQIDTPELEQLGTLPPRSLKHQHRKRGKKKPARPNLILVRLIFLAFVSMILSIIVFLLWQEFNMLR